MINQNHSTGVAFSYPQSDFASCYDFTVVSEAIQSSFGEFKATTAAKLQLGSNFCLFKMRTIAMLMLTLIFTESSGENNAHSSIAGDEIIEEYESFLFV